MRPHFAVLFSLALSCGSYASAQEARSRPVGYLTQTILPGQTRSFSIPFDADVSSLSSTVGKLTAVGMNYLESSAATWTPGAFTAPESPYFVRITSGAQAGRTFRIVTPANTATRLYIADDGLGLQSLALATGADGARFEILPADTLSTFFGTGGDLVLHGAASAAEADLVQVWGGAAWLNFYYNTTWNRWARDTDTISDPSRNHFLLRPDRGVMITRRGATPLELLVAGRVLNTPQRAFHSRSDNALTFLATMQARDVTLGELALQSPDRALNWRGSTDAAQADLVIVWSGSTWFSFYYHTGNARWQRVGDPSDRNSYLIKAGTPVFVQRRGGGTTADDKTVVFPAAGS
jgi:uncharacterized protein (TIGR02597 family)